MNRRSIFKNAVFGLVAEFLTILFGFIVPRIFITNYGSDVNGLLTTLTQIFTYMALLEAGISQAARNALYKPLHDKSIYEVSVVLSTAKSYFRKISTLYFVGVLLLSATAPVFIKTEVDHLTVTLVVLIEGISKALSFYFVQTYTALLRTDGKAYIISAIDLFYKIASYAVRIIMAVNGISIIILQTGYLALTLIKIVFYKLYISSNYPWIDFNVDCKDIKLPDRNSYIITEIAWTVFSSTDLIVLSTFLSTRHASVYSVYNMVFVGMSSALNSVYHNINYILGMTYHESIESYEKIHDDFMSVFIGAMSIIMSVSYILIIPFIKLYTKGISDIDYIHKELPVMFCLVQLISWSRYIQGNLTGVAGYARETSKVSIVEAVTNILLSVVLVKKFGIAGVLFATVFALPLKVVYTTYISDKKVMHRSYKNSVVIIGVNFLLFFASVIISRYFYLEINGIVRFVVVGIILTIIIGVIGIGINVLANPGCMELIKKIGRRKHHESIY